MAAGKLVTENLIKKTKKNEKTIPGGIIGFSRAE